MRLLFCAAALAGASGCYTHQCDSSTGTFTGGDMLDEDTYETSPLADPSRPWVGFAGEETVVVSFPADVVSRVAGRPIATIDAYVGTSDQPNGGGATFTGTSGQLAEIADAGSTGLSVTNASCATYSLRVVVRFGAVGGDAGTGD
jgi:hypothetical protein